MMKKIQMTIDEQLLHNVDQAVQTLDITRSTFIREALQRLKIAEMEQKHIAGYACRPVGANESAAWESE